MKTVAGVFPSRFAAERASEKLLALGIPQNSIHVLTPEATQDELAQVPTMTTEQRGMGKAMGAAMGSAVGIAGAGALGSLLVPGLGPVLAISLAGGVLGAVGGGIAGEAVEENDTRGLPEDELFVYEDALRQGRSVVIAETQGDRQAQAVRGALESAGAESIDRAQEMWWIGLRNAEKETYEADGSNFPEDERDFRSGFEAAQHFTNRGKSYEQCHAQLAGRYPKAYKSKPFRRGYDRGRAYFDTLRTAKSRP